MRVSFRRLLVVSLAMVTAAAGGLAYRAGYARPVTLFAEPTQPVYPQPAIDDAIYIVDAASARRAEATHITGDGGLNIPIGWSADGALLFVSDRIGRPALFAQPPDGDVARLISDYRGISEHARATPDGGAILFVAQPMQLSVPHRIMRVSVDGGPIETTASGAFLDGGARCAVAPAMLCAVAERHDDGRHVIFSALNPVSGRGRELARVGADDFGDLRWALSPDGLRIAVTDAKNPRIRILMIGGPAAESIAVSGHAGFANISFTSNSRGVLVPSTNIAGASLLSISFSGDTRVVWQEPGAIGIAGLPSPDGRHVAVWVRSRHSS